MSRRYAPAERLLTLGLALADARVGLTLDEMATLLGVGRRTAERLRDALHRLMPDAMREEVLEDGTKRWRVPAGRLATLQPPSRDELLELRLAAERARQQGLRLEAERLTSLALKLEAAQTRAAWRPVEGDLTDLLRGTGAVVRPGPEESLEPAIVAGLRDAFLANRVVRLVYRRRDTAERSFPLLHPYGFLTGSRAYLVGFNPHPEVCEHRLYAIGNIERLTPMETGFVRDERFNLQAFAARSFGAFWDGERFDVVWRFSAAVAADARGFRFHRDQRVSEDAAGRVSVAFTASGLTEMAWHLFTWGAHVEVLAPEALKVRYRACLSEARDALGTADA
ncbi:hypothetical protein ASG60_20635 [Methylobacterium sp. Leaf469]|uniref:helix-turn-helix transcriptional regulator n=1 Tax=Methylobacterium sp. Leaf469 TaxID=1736387 RepID=UPI0006F3A61B|nr:WYL domain-containing protein [Methylobacterium sp. Leaf469]KQT96090.1 hypothetical protein ASG60_20635 [Methylobacterium sp. Leaf469]